MTRGGAAGSAVSDARHVVPLVERNYPLLLRIASSRRARPAEVRGVLAEAVRAAAAAAPADAERVLLRTAIGRTQSLERQAPPEQWEPVDEPAVDLRQVERAGSRWEGWFRADPPSLSRLESGRRAGEARRAAEEALARLPLGQRVVVVLRDVGGWSAEDVAQLLRVDAAVQRALLHTGRARVRRALERVAAARAAHG